MINKIKIPRIVRIYSPDNEEGDILNTYSEVWELKFGGNRLRINWRKLGFQMQLASYLKLFIVYRLQNRSSASVYYGDYQFLRHLKKYNLTLPFSTSNILEFFEVVDNYKSISIFKSLYSWALQRGLDGFDNTTLQEIKEFKKYRKKPYNDIFLRQTYLNDNDLKQIFFKIERFNEFRSFEKLRNNIILSMSYELAPRRSQFFLLKISDFIVLNGPSSKFYSINLPMSKKRKSMKLEKRYRSISSKLGEKVEYFLNLHPNKTEKNAPLFVKKNGDGLKVHQFSKIVSDELNNSITITHLRHHLAQSLADQGASAEVIAEILGHNSTIPARAYITATPKIAEIKSEALGKNKRYQEIMEMMNTGKIVDKSTISKERWVKGIVGNQYIGGIGACGLPSNTACPKNPVYACYTCIKFHPFVDGRHAKVKEGLQKQVQYHIDIAEADKDIEHNRSLLQLKKTIDAVDTVMEKIKYKDETKPTP